MRVSLWVAGSLFLSGYCWASTEQDTSFIDLRYQLTAIEHEWLAHEQTYASHLTGLWHQAFSLVSDMQGLVELSANVKVLSDNYNDGTTSQYTDYALWVAPEYIALNQAVLIWPFAEDARVSLGRQTIAWDNQRFVGANTSMVRQQSFDSFLVEYPIKDWRLRYAYVWDVNTVFDPDDDAGRFDANSHLVNVAYHHSAALQWTGYYYHQDLQASQRDKANRTLGSFVTGEPVLMSVPLHYRLEYAKQRQLAHDNEADYYHVQFGAQLQHWRVTLGVENLEGDGQYEFVTPLGSNYEHNGWSQRFIFGQAGNGLQDRFVRLQRDFATDWRFEFEYHAHTRPAAQENAGQIDYGDEWGFKVQRHSGPWLVEMGYDRYRPEDGNNQILLIGSNTQRAWLMLRYRYDGL